MENIESDFQQSSSLGNVLSMMDKNATNSDVTNETRIDEIDEMQNEVTTWKKWPITAKGHFETMWASSNEQRPKQVVDLLIVSPYLPV